MRRRLFTPFLALVAFGLACASMESPPGGPPDAAPPRLLRVVPDTGAVNVRPRNAIFQFDEVVSERPRSGASLADLFLISPSLGALRIDWDRDAIEVRPRDNWRPNTTYTVTLLPGMTDLRGNTSTEGATIVFSTGPEIATSVVRGIVFDWVAGRVAPRAYIEAISRPDSIVYVGTADSSGSFVVPNIPPGEYTVVAMIDANNNRAIDPREMWDSTHVIVGDSARVEMLTHAHDTIPPRIDRVVPRDTFSIRVTMDRPIDPSMTIGPSLFTLLASDSTVVPIAEARAAQAFEREQAERDRARADSVTRAAPPLPTGERVTATVVAAVPSRPSPVTEVIIVLSRALRPGATYRLRTGEIRGIMGTSRESEREFTVPERPAVARDTVPPPATPPPVVPPTSGGTPPPPATGHPRPSPS